MRDYLRDKLLLPAGSCTGEGTKSRPRIDTINPVASNNNNNNKSWFYEGLGAGFSLVFPGLREFQNNYFCKSFEDLKTLRHDC